MRRIALALSIVLALARGAAAEFVAQAKDFRCLLDGRAVAGKHFFSSTASTASCGRRCASPSAICRPGATRWVRSCSSSPSRRW
jgi:hypothetical protein